jgi:hypothetical protein
LEDAGHSSVLYTCKYFVVLVIAEVKRIVSRDEYFFKAYNNKQVLSVHALLVFQIFSFLVDVKIKLKILACSFEIIT